ncbi:hypothetical protein GW17_00001241, partial [Ensete ventricosum]
ARGLKKHLKRLHAPRHWRLDKLGGAFVSRNLYISNFFSSSAGFAQSSLDREAFRI